MRNDLFFEHLEGNQYTTIMRKIPARGAIIRAKEIISSPYRKELLEKKAIIEETLDTLGRDWEEETDVTLKEAIQTKAMTLYQDLQLNVELIGSAPSTIKAERFRIVDIERYSTIRKPKRRFGRTIRKGKYKYLVLAEKM